VSGGLAYYLIALVATRSKILACRNATSCQAIKALPAISLLKPLRGADPDLAAYLETFFQQDYPAFEILFAVRQPEDPAVAVVQELQARYPQIPTRLLFTGEPPYANAKVYSMELMARAATHSILVITDSDASVAPD